MNKKKYIERMPFTVTPKTNISFDQLDEIFGASKESYIDILVKIISEYQQYHAEIIEFIKKSDMESYRRSRHKISSSLSLLKLDDFLQYLNLVKTEFTLANSDIEIIERNCKTCFEEIEIQLKKKIQELS